MNNCKCDTQQNIMNKILLNKNVELYDADLTNILLDRIQCLEKKLYDVNFES